MKSFGPIDRPFAVRYFGDKPDRPSAQRPSDPPQGVQKGEVNMTTPSTSELLVEETRAAERLRILLIAKECKTLEEFVKRLLELIDASKR